MKITRLFAAALLLVSGFFGEAATAARASIYVSDQGGQSLGMLMDIHDGSSLGLSGTVVKLFIPEISRYVTIDTVTGAAGSQNVSIYYSSRGCLGRSFVDETLFYSVVRYFEGYVTGMDAAPMTIRPRSRFDIGPRGIGTCTNLRVLEAIDVVPALELKELPFKTPVLLPLGFKG